MFYSRLGFKKTFWMVSSEWPTMFVIWSVSGLKRLVGTYVCLAAASFRETPRNEVLGRTVLQLNVSNLELPREL